MQIARVRFRSILTESEEKPLLKNDERRIRGLRMAFELSVSGLYADSHEIESALQRAGYTDAHEWLDGNSIREELERECDRAKSGSEPSSG